VVLEKHDDFCARRIAAVNQRPLPSGRGEVVGVAIAGGR
jgi:hypothetical protein